MRITYLTSGSISSKKQQLGWQEDCMRLFLLDGILPVLVAGEWACCGTEFLARVVFVADAISREILGMISILTTAAVRCL